MCYPTIMKLSIFILLIFGSVLATSFFLSTSQKSSSTADEKQEVNHAEYEEPEPEGETFVVEIKNSTFTPNTLKVEHGSIVAFVNKDSILHTVTSDTAGTDKHGSFDLGEIKTGEQISAARYDVKGEYTYHCKIHPEMKGKIIVH